MRHAEINRRAVLLAAAGGIAALAGCGSATATDPGVSSTPLTPAASGLRAATPSSVSARPAASTPTRPPDPARVRANELGVIPVMMYHRLTETPGQFDISPAAFRAQLVRLFASGYRPVHARDLATGHIDIPAGTTPVVLTFDDSSPNQFRLRPDGSLDPSCAAGILTAVCRQFPHCYPRATFYVNQNPFGLETAAEQAVGLRALLRFGFQLGNHTLDHANLAHLSSTDVQREFVELAELVRRAVPAARLDTMAFPFGVTPRDGALARTGRWNGTPYEFSVALLVGANPAPSPFSADFDPYNVPRIRGSSWMGGTVPLTGNYWLDYLQAHPDERYVSAGNPGRITVPKAQRSKVAAHWAGRVVTY